MNVKVVAAILIALFASGIVFASPAFGCVEDPSEEYLCVKWSAPKPVARVATNTLTAAPSAQQVAVVRTGKSPEDAIEANDTWLPIPAKTTLWYRMPYSSDPLRLDVWLDAYGRTGLTLAIYSPDKEKDLWNEKPIGRGAYNKSEPLHDLWWTGESIVVGTWYSQVTNNNSFSVDHKVGYKRRGFSRSCVQYWEVLPTGLPAFWTLCDKENQ